MSKSRRFGLLCIVAILAPSLGWCCLSPRAAQALGAPLAWVGLSNQTGFAQDEVIAIEPVDPGEAMHLQDSLGAPVLGSGEVLSTDPVMENPNVSPAMYSLHQVMQWAYDRSPEAKLIEAEMNAVMRNIDPKDPDQCCSARLVRNVLREVALARRHDDATHAAVAYHKLVAATQAVALANEAIATADQLISMADQADRLELSDGNPLKLRQTRLDTVSLKSKQSFNTLKLRQELSRLTGRSETEVSTAIMTDGLPVDPPAIIAGQAVMMAHAQRHDRRAVQTLCRELRSCNVDAARLLMGIVNPGVGLTLATATKKLFQCFKEDRSDDDLNARRRQCAQLKNSLEVIIRNETLQAVLDVRSAAARLKLIDEQLQLASQRLDDAQGKIQIEEESPGSDLLIQLEISELRGKRLAIQKELALATDDLEHAKNTPIR